MEKEHLSNKSNCPTCGKPIPEGAPQGMCPSCLMDHASMATDTQLTGGMLIHPPSLETMRAVFPELEIDSLVGQGGMGFVYKARQSKLDRWVALKVLSPSLAENPDFAKRFEREAKLLARLNHPNIVAVYDFGRQGDFFFLLMELVEGVNLREAMRTERFAPQKALSIVPNICEALQFAHDEGVLHRDIKPENILLDTKGRIKIADFGIAKMLDDGSSNVTGLTKHGASMGTPHYMAPEQIENPSEVDHRADIYSLGVVFYELLTGELPLGRFGPPSEKSGADTGVDDIVFQALAKEKEHRQQKVSEIKTQVETVSKQPKANPNPQETSTDANRGVPVRGSDASGGWWQLDSGARKRLMGVLGLMAWMLSLYFMYPHHITQMEPNAAGSGLAYIWTFGGGAEPWLELRRTFGSTGWKESYRFAGLGGGYMLGVAAFAVWSLWMVLAWKEWGRSITAMPLGRGSQFSQDGRRKRIIPVAITQHFVMALITFLLFGLLVALYGGHPPIPLFPFFVANQFMAVLIYAIEWSLAKKEIPARRKMGHTAFRNLSPKGMTLLIIAMLLLPVVLWIWSFWQMRQSQADAHRQDLEGRVVQSQLAQLIAVNRVEMQQLQDEIDKRAMLLESITDPEEISRLELAQQESTSELQQKQDQISIAERRTAISRAQSHDTYFIETPLPWAMLLTTIVPIVLILTSIYGWRMLNRIRRGLLGRDFMLPAMVAALPLTILIVDTAVGALVLLPFNHGVWVNAGISLSIIAIIAVDVWLVRIVLKWLKSGRDHIEEIFNSTRPKAVEAHDEDAESKFLNANEKEDKGKFLGSIFVITICLTVCSWDYFDRKTKLLEFEPDYDRISAPYQNGSVNGTDVGIPLADLLETARERQSLIYSALFEREELYTEFTATLEDASDPTFRKAVTNRLIELETDITQLKNSLNDSQIELRRLEPVRQALLMREEMTRRLSKRNVILICSSMFLCCLLSIFGFKTLRRIRNGKAPHLSAAAGCLIALFGPLSVLDFFIYLIFVIKFRNPPLGFFAAATFDLCVFLVALSWVRGWSLAVTNKPFTNNQSD